MPTKRDRQRARRAGAAQRLVAGEPYEVLVGDLLSFEWEHEDDGMVHIQAKGRRRRAEGGGLAGHIIAASEAEAP